MNQSTLDALIGSIYSGVTAANGFQQFIAEFSTAADASGVLLIVRHAVSQEMQGIWVHGMEPAFLQSYALRYAGQDVLALHMARAPIGQFYASNLDVPERAHYHELPFYREWVQPQGMAYAAGCVILREGQWLTQIFLQRSHAHPPFSRRTMVQLERLVPHLQRARCWTLASALCGGKTLEQVACERGTAISTARSQLNSIFSKTGTRRQTDLLSLLLTSPAYFLASKGSA